MAIDHKKVNENSKQAIQGLQPASVWQFFYELSRIPRPSCKEQQVVEWVKAYAKKNNFDIDIDPKLNVVVKVPATPGYEKATTIVIQGHMDMVCEKEPTTEHDFDKDPIELKRDNEWITANETTLGADNGIGVVIGMAVVLDDSIKHGPIELLLTSDEEMGMTGAMSLKSGFVTEPSILMNLDSEEDGALYVGCAGGADTEVKLPIVSSTPSNGYTRYNLKLGGLAGGHSGCDVHLNRGNANKIMATFLEHLIEQGVNPEIVSFNGGSKRNAIPRDAVVDLYLSQDDATKVNAIIEKLNMKEMFEYQSYEFPWFKLVKAATSIVPTVFTQETTLKMLKIILATTSGIVSMSQEIENMVETSTTLSVVKTEGQHVIIASLSRSSNNVALARTTRQVRAPGDLVGAITRTYGEYPGWQPNAKSQVLETTKSVYADLNKGKEPEIKSIHAGLECGLLVGIYPKMDPISFGPTIEGAHSPSERVRIPDVAICYDLAKAVISKIAESTK